MSDAPSRPPAVGIIMGSKSDRKTMDPAAQMLFSFNIPYEYRVVSAHRTPAWMCEYAQTAKKRGIRIIIAAAGGAAHLPGMTAAQTILPVLGVPVAASGLAGVDALLSIVQMPKGIPTATFSIGEWGAVNAALFAIRILALSDEALARSLEDWVERRTAEVLTETTITLEE
jgi:5-(carboxyamino)imidazole ribonucleotide mutase